MKIGISVFKNQLRYLDEITNTVDIMYIITLNKSENANLQSLRSYLIVIISSVVLFWVSRKLLKHFSQKQVVESCILEFNRVK